MSELALNCEILNRILEGYEISKDQSYEVFEQSKNDSSELLVTAQKLREKKYGNAVTFSKKVFFNLVNLCRDTCSYCTYKADPEEVKLSMMSKKEVKELAKLARKHSCVEALFVTGEKPEERYELARKWLKKNGFASTAEYLVHASETALSEGLFPHTNAGNLSKSELAELKPSNVSMGLMLENVSERLTEKGMPHHLAPSKKPKERLQVLENAGKLGIPMTTGVLVGIGETTYEIIDSIFAIKEIHKKYNHIQEIILQNFHPKPDTLMKDYPAAAEDYFKTVVALARIIAPEINLQIPPNLSSKSYTSFLSAGINDWGGISPLTPDYVNPEFSWPEIRRIVQNCKNAGFELKCRFPVYQEFFHMVPQVLQEKMSSINDGENFVRYEYWR